MIAEFRKMKFIQMIFFDCLKYIELNLKLQEIAKLVLSYIFKPLIVLEGTFSGQIKVFDVKYFLCKHSMHDNNF